MSAQWWRCCCQAGLVGSDERRDGLNTIGVYLQAVQTAYPTAFTYQGITDPLDEVDLSVYDVIFERGGNSLDFTDAEVDALVEWITGSTRRRLVLVGEFATAAPGNASNARLNTIASALSRTTRFQVTGLMWDTGIDRTRYCDVNSGLALCADVDDIWCAATSPLQDWKTQPWAYAVAMMNALPDDAFIVQERIVPENGGIDAGDVVFVHDNNLLDNTNYGVTYDTVPEHNVKLVLNMCTLLNA